MKLAVLQSNYIPWKGYFDIIHNVDLFLFYDEVSYTKNDWRNRNQILTEKGKQWLTVPVHGSTTLPIQNIQIVEGRWQRQHYQALVTNYAKAPFFSQYRDFIEDIYLNRKWKSLSDLNQTLIQKISRDFLGIRTEFGRSSDYSSSGSGHQKLLSLVKAVGADSYLSGPAAREYIHSDDYEEAGIQLEWMDYSGYPEYNQLFQPFQHQVSILDLLFNTGERASEYIWGWRSKTQAI
jgi:hypothetical protein